MIIIGVDPHKGSHTAVAWACPGLTDIHHQARSAGKDAHYGDRGEEEAPAPSFVHTGVQG